MKLKSHNSQNEFIFQEIYFFFYIFILSKIRRYVLDWHKYLYLFLLLQKSFFLPSTNPLCIFHRHNQLIHRVLKIVKTNFSSYDSSIFKKKKVSHWDTNRIAFLKAMIQFQVSKGFLFILLNDLSKIELSKSSYSFFS